MLWREAARAAFVHRFVDGSRGSSAPSRCFTLNALRLGCGPSVLFLFEQDKCRLHAEASRIALIGIVVCPRDQLVDGIHRVMLKLAQHLAVVARHANNRTLRPPLDHGVHHAGVDDVVGQGAGRLADIIGRDLTPNPYGTKDVFWNPRIRPNCCISTTSRELICPKLLLSPR